MDGTGKKRGKKTRNRSGKQRRNLKCHFRQVGETENAAEFLMMFDC